MKLRPKNIIQDAQIRDAISRLQSAARLLKEAGEPVLSMRADGLARTADLARHEYDLVTETTDVQEVVRA